MNIFLCQNLRDYTSKIEVDLNVFTLHGAVLKKKPALPSGLLFWLQYEGNAQLGSGVCRITHNSGRPHPVWSTLPSQTIVDRSSNRLQAKAICLKHVNALLTQKPNARNIHQNSVAD